LGVAAGGLLTNCDRRAGAAVELSCATIFCSGCPIARRYQHLSTFPTYGSPWTPDMARTEAKRLLGLIASGEDPAEHPPPGRGLRDR
jgi:hypothetical protein